MSIIKILPVTPYASSSTSSLSSSSSSMTSEFNYSSNPYMSAGSFIEPSASTVSSSSSSSSSSTSSNQQPHHLNHHLSNSSTNQQVYFWNRLLLSKLRLYNFFSIVFFRFSSYFVLFVNFSGKKILGSIYFDVNFFFRAIFKFLALCVLNILKKYIDMKFLFFHQHH